ncbi:hypothetical protein EVAR_37358_1 [Eumeta japonica]|uniref:Uncharacterized protein n=1 Tax=Eumeta variegata TaxID=151549 RepID=A0A4C1WZD7_EUMVA|nr:hypothetical protein EVAR_37358_1 [Eumeta japonica]
MYTEKRARPDATAVRGTIRQRQNAGAGSGPAVIDLGAGPEIWTGAPPRGRVRRPRAPHRLMIEIRSIGARGRLVFLLSLVCVSNKARRLICITDNNENGVVRAGAARVFLAARRCGRGRSRARNSLPLIDGNDRKLHRQRVEHSSSGGTFRVLFRHEYPLRVLDDNLRRVPNASIRAAGHALSGRRGGAGRGGRGGQVWRACARPAAAAALARTGPAPRDDRLDGPREAALARPPSEIDSSTCPIPVNKLLPMMNAVPAITGGETKNTFQKRDNNERVRRAEDAAATRAGRR